MRERVRDRERERDRETERQRERESCGGNANEYKVCAVFGVANWCLKSHASRLEVMTLLRDIFD